MIEMLVSIAVFSIVALAATAALFKIIDANKRTQAIKTSVNNLNFAMDEMSRDIRLGIEYTITINGGTICFKDRRTNNSVFYSYKEDGNGSGLGCISKTLTNNLATNCITSKEINITGLTFTGYGLGMVSYNISQPMVRINVSARVTVVDVTSTLNIQTAVVQRALNKSNLTAIDPSP